VGRPFPLDEAPENWRRLKSWGLTMSTSGGVASSLVGNSEVRSSRRVKGLMKIVRINVTWEALEHAAP
jgi:hypothetical protein